MNVITSRPFLFWSLVYIVHYAVVGMIVPGVYISLGGLFFMLGAGVFTMFRYGAKAWEVVFDNLRNKDSEGGDGSHLAIIGVTLLAMGAIYTGCFGLLWIYNGAPTSWSNTAYSALGRHLMGIGFCGLLISPDITKKGLNLPARLWIVAIVILALMMTFIFGVRVGEYRAEVSAEYAMPRISTGG